MKTIKMVYDNGGESIDRYTVVTDCEEIDGALFSLHLSEDCTAPNGVSMCGSVIPGEHLGREISFTELPERMQEHIRKQLS